MAYNGNGIFVRIYNWVNDKNNGIKILASRMDAETQGIADGLSNVICKDGQSTPTANIPLGNFKITGLGSATQAQDAVNAGQIQGNLLTSYLDTGAADAYIITPSPVISAYVAYQSWKVKIANTNLTTTPTLNANGLGAKPIKLSDLSAPAIGSLVVGGIYEFTYDGTNMQLDNTAAASSVAHLTSGTITGVTINNSVIGGTTPAAGTFSSLNTTGTGGGASVVFADTANAGGSNIQLSGNGAITPNKFIRAAGGLFQILSNAYSVIATLTDAGNLTVSGTVTANGVVLGNGLVQSVNTTFSAAATGTTLIPDDDTIPQITEGTEFMTRAITPTNSSNKLKITIVVNHACATQTNIYGALFQDATTNALAAWNMNQINVINSPMSSTFIYYMTAGTTSSTTFRFRAGPGSANTVTFNGYGGARKMGGAYASSMTIEELSV